MNELFRTKSPADYDRWILLLQDFRSAYLPYIEETKMALYEGSSVKYTIERSKIVSLATKAQLALDVASMDLVITPKPSAPDKPMLSGLVNVALAHEDPAYRTDPAIYDIEPDKQSFERTVDLIDAASAKLEQLKWQERQRRRQVTYWIDRCLRAVLGIPAYLISLILGFDRHELSGGRARVLWGVSLVADVMGIVAAGVAFGWWG